MRIWLLLPLLCVPHIVLNEVGAEFAEEHEDVSLLQVFTQPIARTTTTTASTARHVAGKSHTSTPRINSSEGHDSHEKARPDHFWAKRGRNEMSNSFTPYTASALLRTPSWTWQNELDEEVRHSPLIDRDMNIYVTTGTHIRKFSSKGVALWSWQVHPDDSKMVASPALYGDAIYAVTSDNITMYSIDMASGAVNWRRSPKPLLNQYPDASSVFVYNDTMIFASMKDNPVGNNVVHAVRVKDGHPLWNFTVDDVVWNFMPATPGDGTLLFATNCGGVYKLDFGGQLIWRRGRRGPGLQCSTGGGALGPNGVYYLEYTEPSLGTRAYIKAYRISDGALLWKKILPAPFGGFQYPAVGRLANGTLAVITAVGQETSPPNRMNKKLEPVPPWRRLRNAVFALDALSGGVLWSFEEKPWDHIAAAGENSKFAERRAQALQDPRHDIMCVPDVAGIPVITGDGLVYYSSAHNGDLRAIEDKNGDGLIDEKLETSVFSTHNCFLNSPSVAPGMLVAAPCWGPMYVFKN